jgi:hypothetical protein
MRKKIWGWITASRVNKVVAAGCAALLVLAVVSGVGAYTFHSSMQTAKKAEKAQKERADRLEAEGEAKAAAFQKAIGATDPALKSALQGVREAKASLAQAEAARRDPWIPPTVDNLAIRFDQALEAIR